MSRTMSFDKVKETFLAYMPQLLQNAITTGEGCVSAHLAAFDEHARWFADHPEFRVSRTPGVLMWNVARKRIVEIVASWDVRSVGDLVALVPHAFPSWVANGLYDFELGDGGWYLVAKGGR